MWEGKCVIWSWNFLQFSIKYETIWVCVEPFNCYAYAAYDKHIYWINKWKMMSQIVLRKYSSYFSEVFLKITNEILQVLYYLIIYKKHIKLLNTINFIFTVSPGFVFAFQSFPLLHPSIVDVIRSLVWVLKRDCWKIIFLTDSK